MTRVIGGRPAPPSLPYLRPGAMYEPFTLPWWRVMLRTLRLEFRDAWRAATREPPEARPRHYRQFVDHPVVSYDRKVSQEPFRVRRRV